MALFPLDLAFIWVTSYLGNLRCIYYAGETRCCRDLESSIELERQESQGPPSISRSTKRKPSVSTPYKMRKICTGTISSIVPLLAIQHFLVRPKTPRGSPSPSLFLRGFAPWTKTLKLRENVPRCEMSCIHPAFGEKFFNVFLESGGRVCSTV